MSTSSAQQPVSRVIRVLKSKTLISATAVVLLYTLAGFFLAPYLVKRQLTQFVSDDLQRQLAIDQVRVNPYTLRMAIDGVSLREGNGDPLLAFARLVVDLDISSLWERAWTFAEIGLEKPELTLAIDAAGRANLQRLVDDLPAGSESPAAASDAPPARLLVRWLHIGEGTLHLADNSEPTPAEATLAPLDLEMHDLTSIPQREGPHQLVARLPGGGSLEWRGEASLFPVHSHGKILVKGLKLGNAWRFFQDILITDEPGGSLDLETGYRFALEQGDVMLTLDQLSGQLSELTIKPRGTDEPVLALSSAALDGGSFDLAERRLSFAGVTLARGKVLTQFDRQGELNWQTLLAPSAPAAAAQRAAASPTEEPAATAEPWRLDLGKVIVTDVAVNGTDLSRNVPIHISLGNVSLSMHLVSVLAPDQVQTVVDGFAATISDIQLAEREDRKSLASVAEIQLAGGAFDLSDRHIALKALSLRGGDLAVSRDRDGRIDWVQQALDPGVVRGEARDAGARAKSEGHPWSVVVNKVQVTDTSMSFVDQSLDKSDLLGLDDIALTLTDVSLDPRQSVGFDVALQIQQGGTVLGKGTVQPFQTRVDGTVEIKQLNLAMAQPFVDSLAHVQLASGTLSAGGAVHYGDERAGALEFAGDLSVAFLMVLEPHTGKTLLGWDDLKTQGMRLGLAPNGLMLEEIVLSRPEGTFVIDENKVTNWQYVLKDQPGGTPTDTTAAAASTSDDAPTNPTAQSVFPVSIARIRLEDGALNFADLSLTPQFATHIHELSGSIAGLSTTPGAKANVELEGRVEEYGKARIRGELQPSSPTDTTDIHMNFENVEMTHLTPYSIKFAGHKVTAGKLSLDLGYKIDHHQLTGDNQIVVQHLELGEKVDSPDALDLPLELGLALLKDPSGKIAINLPVRGDMSDPQFNFGQLIGQAVVNFFGKLVTAPFQILGGILGSEAQGLDQIAFEPGRSDLPPPEQEKLTMVAKALRERPQLAVSIEGTYDSRRDGAVLKELKIRRAVAEARGDRTNPGQHPGPVSYNDPKSQRALEQLANKRISPGARARLKEQFAGSETPAKTNDGKAAAQPSADTAVADTSGFYEAIYGELVDTAVITHKELRSLANDRAKSVRQELTGRDGIPEKRVSLAAPAKAEHSSSKAAGVITRLDLTAAK